MWTLPYPAIISNGWDLWSLIIVNFLEVAAVALDQILNNKSKQLFRRANAQSSMKAKQPFMVCGIPLIWSGDSVLWTLFPQITLTCSTTTTTSLWPKMMPTLIAHWRRPSKISPQQQLEQALVGHCEEEIHRFPFLATGHCNHLDTFRNC